ncbi:MAG: prepilin-type N-terminal cleavage/methylation domain-containing protein [Caldimonas sp.]
MARRRIRGFTLVEVLVAIVVMAIMSLMAWQGVDAVVRSRDANQIHLERTLRLETVISQWEQDLASLQESTAVPALTCDGQSVRLTRRAEGGLQVVAWSLRPGARDSVWQRWAGPAVTTTTALQESWLRSQQFHGNETGQLRALEGLDQWQVFFFQGNAWANCQSTGNVAAPASAAAPAGVQRLALPSGVRLVLAFAPGSGLTGSLLRDTLIAP